MVTRVHLVGSIGLDTVDDVFATAGEILGKYLKRVPDGEPGGRRSWIAWQYPVLRANPFLRVDTDHKTLTGIFPPIRLARGVAPTQLKFGELGYAREARASYEDFVKARKSGELPKDVRFLVCLPTPYAVVTTFCTRADYGIPAILPAYEAAMLGEIQTMCEHIPPNELAIQWDVCMEMLAWDGRWRIPTFPGMETMFGESVCEISGRRAK